MAQTSDLSTSKIFKDILIFFYLLSAKCMKIFFPHVYIILQKKYNSLPQPSLDWDNQRENMMPFATFFPRKNFPGLTN